MVTKRLRLISFSAFCSVLAKIHMVTKPDAQFGTWIISSVLAKIHMVTKLD